MAHDEMFSTWVQKSASCTQFENFQKIDASDVLSNIKEDLRNFFQCLLIGSSIIIGRGHEELSMILKRESGSMAYSIRSRSEVFPRAINR